MAMSLLLLCCVRHRIDFGAASEDELRAFHKAAADHFAEIVDSTAATSTLPAAIEANYHAALGNIAPPCPLAGILDGVAAAARREYDLENYLGVVTLLGPLVNERVSEDLVAMLAESYAWTNNYGESFTLSDQAVKRNRNYAWLYISICKAAIRSHEWDVARKAVRKAEAVEPGSYEVDLYKGRIAERDRAPDTAIAHFQDACSKTEKDPWPHFYLARALLRYGKPEEALDAIASGQRLVSDRPFRRSDRHFENALMSQQVLALLLVGQDEPARKLLEILETREDVRPEIIVCAAFVRARDDALSAGQSSLECFEAALKRLNAGDSQKRFTRQQILYFRRGSLRKLGTCGRQNANSIRLQALTRTMFTSRRAFLMSWSRSQNTPRLSPTGMQLTRPPNVLLKSPRLFCFTIPTINGHFMFRKICITSSEWSSKRVDPLSHRFRHGNLHGRTTEPP